LVGEGSSLCSEPSRFVDLGAVEPTALNLQAASGGPNANRFIYAAGPPRPCLKDFARIRYIFRSEGMGRLVRTTTGEQCHLESEHLVGRSPRAALQLDSSFVSSQHATIRWVGDGWELKDLGSRNGTAVDGAPVPAGQAVRLHAGAT